MKTGKSPLHRCSVLLLFLVLSFAAAAMGVFFPPGEWYQTLQRPFYAPPNWLFGPVWTLLYLMIATAGWLVWNETGWRSRPMAIWFVQLLLNALWTPLFFGLQLPGWALLEMSLLWLAIVACVLSFRRVRTLATVLMLPYLAWVSFAWLLNAGFWWLNR